MLVVVFFLSPGLGKRDGKGAKEKARGDKEGRRKGRKDGVERRPHISSFMNSILGTSSLKLTLRPSKKDPSKYLYTEY